MTPERQKALMRMAVLFGTIPIALLIGLAAHSKSAFIIAMAIGVVLHLILRLTILR